MKKSEAFKSKYMGKDDLANGPVVGTIQDVSTTTLKDDDGHDESKTIMYFSNIPKPWLVNLTNWDTCEAAFGEESDDWAGHKIELFVDPTVMMKGKRTGGVRCRAVSEPETPIGVAFEVPFGEEVKPVMTYDDALIKCLAAGVKKEELLTHLRASGHKGWNIKCPELVEQLIRVAEAANRADTAKAGPVEDHTQDLEDDIPFD